MYQFLTVLAITRDQLNDSPVMKYIMIAVFIIGGPFFIVNGIRGIKNREITVKSRRRSADYTGEQAVLAGWVQIVLGIIFMSVGILTLIFR